MRFVRQHANVPVPKKLDISDQLQKALTSLRKIPHPGYFGSLGKTMLQDGIFWTQEPSAAMNGPFSTEDELIDGMTKRYIHDCGERVVNQAEYYRRVIPKVLRGNDESVFTHNDLQLKNISLRPDGTVFIVDWAASGWCPLYWEYATTIRGCGHFTNDWHAYISRFLGEYPNEYSWMKALRLEMWG
ncbi:hypothetical protein PT974_03224 [Cladobotryum mycophilum]|uniref:Aminoglycoside phosphotransferase domain-containing protein n=1 Tax=Cladobotryum mycophilum TaxID=491253 RepID=A0ABR0SRT0_9HYPO